MIIIYLLLFFTIVHTDNKSQTPTVNERDLGNTFSGVIYNKDTKWSRLKELTNAESTYLAVMQNSLLIE